MRLELPLLLVFLAYVASDAYQSDYFNGEPDPYHYNDPYYRADPEDLRQIMFSLGLPSRQTVTVTSTVRPTLIFPSFPSLSLPNYLSLTQVKLNSTIEDQETTTDVTVTEENEEQFTTITPSIVQKVEPTQMSNRGTRTADPQLMVISQPQSTFRSGSFNYRPVVVPFYGTHGVPVADQRVFFSQLTGLPARVMTTVFTIATSTLTPTCSAAGAILQCPNA